LLGELLIGDGRTVKRGGRLIARVQSNLESLREELRGEDARWDWASCEMSRKVCCRRELNGQASKSGG
jgi:hypothetical protein